MKKEALYPLLISPQSKSKLYISLGLQCPSFTEAIGCFTAAIELAPSVNGYLYRAGAYEANKQLPEAIEDISSAIKLDAQQKNLSLLLSLRGHLYEKLGNIHQAWEDSKKALQLNAENITALNTYSRLLVHKNAIDEALAVLEKILTLEPENKDEIYSSIATIYAKKFDHAKAVTYLNHAIYHNNKCVEYYKRRAVNYFALNTPKLALTDLENAIKLSPEDAELYKLRGNYFKANKQYVRAIADYNQAISLSPEYSEAYLERALLYQFKENAKALEDFNRAIQHKNDYAEAYLERGIYHFLNGDLQETLNDFSAVIEFQPENPKVYVWRSKLYIEQKKFDLAFNDVKQALEFNNKDTMTLFALRKVFDRKNYFVKILELHHLCEKNEIIGFKELPEVLKDFLPTFKAYLIQREKLLNDSVIETRPKRISQVNILILNINEQLRKLGSADSIRLITNPTSLKALCGYMVTHHSFFGKLAVNNDLQITCNDQVIPWEIVRYLKNNQFYEEETDQCIENKDIPLEVKKFKKT